MIWDRDISRVIFFCVLHFSYCLCFLLLFIFFFLFCFVLCFVFRVCFFWRGGGVLHPCLLCSTFCPSRFVIISLGNRELVVYIVFLVSYGCKCSMPLLHSVKGWSSMYDCDFLVILTFWFYCCYSSLYLAAPIRLEVSS